MGHGVARNKFAVRNTHHSAFSLVELVVVMGIVMILLGVLLPSLGRTRHQADLTRYLAEIQQSGLLMEMFAEAHDDEYPFADPSSVGRCSLNWYAPLQSGGYLDEQGARLAAQFEMSLCMAFPPERMVAGNTPALSLWDVDTPVRVRRRETLYPSSKGMLYRIHAIDAADDRYPAVWCCYPNLPRGPLALADGSVTAGTWAEFLAGGVLEVDRTSGVGYPVITTWHGVKGRDR